MRKRVYRYVRYYLEIQKRIAEPSLGVQLQARRIAKVINVGLEIFNDALRAQGVNSVQVSWEPPPKLEKEYEDTLAKML